jgi:hypothetical protein
VIRFIQHDTLFLGKQHPLFTGQMEIGMALEPAGGKEKYLTSVRKQIPVMQSTVGYSDELSELINL